MPVVRIDSKDSEEEKARKLAEIKKANESLKAVREAIKKKYG